MGAIKPTPIALVICDSIYHEQGGKAALVGLFDGIATSQLPIKHPRMAVFASVTGLRAGSRAKLEIVHGESQDRIVTAEGPFPGGPEELTPLTIVDMNFVLGNVLFREAGTYFVQFWCNDYLLLSRPFEVRLIKQGQE